MKIKSLLLTVPMLLASFGYAQVSEKSIFRNGDLEISFVTSFTRIWSDAGSGANMNGAFFRPVLTGMPNFHSLGDLAVRSHNATGQVIAVVRDVSDSGNILVAPLSYTRVWTDAGSGASQDGSVWRPNPPAGYVAMGLVANSGYNAPSLNAMRCIKAEYVIKGGVSGSVIWSDLGSGANQDFSAWGITAPQVSAGSGKIHLSPNTFIGHASHSKPTDANANLYCLILPVKEELPVDTVFPELPVLTSTNQPPLYSGNGTVAITYLPWFSVNDPQLNTLQKIAQSPTYKMVRETRYRRINFTHNQGAETVTMNWSTTFGTSLSKTQSYTQTTGIEMTAGWSGLGVNASITLSLSFTHTNETTSQWYEETTTSIDVPVPVNTASAAYLLESTYKLYRGDSTLVGTELDHRPNGSFYITSFPNQSMNTKNLNREMVKFYPVPAHTGEPITLGLPAANSYELCISDLTGKTVYTVKDVHNGFQINPDLLQKGMYIFRLYNAKESFEKKIVVL
jgi:hypothetical protein